MDDTTLKSLAADLSDLDRLINDASIEEASPDSQGSAHVEHMYKPGETSFGAVAAHLVSNGWSVFPQEMDGQRRPGTVNNEMIKWAEKHHLADRLPEQDTVTLWATHCASLNTAAVFGRGSGYTFALDIDVLDPDLSLRLQELAAEILGYTPLQRVGRWPKIALIYRYKPDQSIASIARKFVEQDENGTVSTSEHGLEIISHGKPLTIFGKHHKTGRYFTWPDKSPLTCRPEDVPEVEEWQVQSWLEACDAVRRFHRGASYDVAATTWKWDESDGLHVPNVRLASGGVAWVENDDGKVVDGREQFLSSLVYRAVRANPGAATDEAGMRKLSGMIFDQFCAHAELSGRWASENSLRRQILAKVQQASRKLAAGEIAASQPVRDAEGNYVESASSESWIPAQPRNQGFDSLSFLPPFVDQATLLDKGKAPRRALRCVVRPHDPAEEKKRRLQPKRDKVAKSVVDGLKKAFDSFFDDVYNRGTALDRQSRVHIVMCPTGGGKTSRSIRYIAEDPRTKEDYEYADDKGNVTRGRAPILFLLPTYANIDELRFRSQVLNLDGSLPDDELRQQAAAANLIHEDELEAKLAELRRDALNAGLVTMVYRGKIAAGCKMAEKVKLAMEAGVGTAGFCKSASKSKDGEIEEKFCEIYHECPAIQQRDEISRSHVVFMPHPFLGLTIPEELKHVRAVVADERIHHLFLHTSTFHLSTLMIARRRPKLTKKETDSGLTPEEVLAERNDAADIATKALQTGACPAEAIWRLRENDLRTGKIINNLGLKLVQSAIRVCSSAIQRDGSITPDLSYDQVKELCSTPTGVEVREEYRFWKIVEERILLMQNKWSTESLIEDARSNLVTSRAKPERHKKANEAFRGIQAKLPVLGDREYRIQFLIDTETTGGSTELVRISWRQQPNWIDTPLMLLDASAAPDIISKIWNSKEVVTHDIPAPLNVRVVGIVDRTYSNASLIASRSASPLEMARAGRMLNKVRQCLNQISALYGRSRVVAGASIVIRRAVNTGWAGPDNIDWCHYGAMRGLDFAKFHAAAVSVGRMEVPVRTIDGLVAALTYDDPKPEPPYDIYGTGLNEKGQPLLLPTGTQVIRMRSGHDIEMPVPMFPGKWGRLIQRQYREEELNQFLGRLRPVYREGEAPIWFALSSVIPDNVIADDLLSIDDFLNSPYVSPDLWEGLRLSGGVLQPDIIAHCHPSAFRSADDVGRLMKRVGFDTKTGDVSQRQAHGFVSLRWAKTRTDASAFAYVRADIGEPEAVLKAAFSQHLGFDPEIVEMASQAPEPTLARRRQEDKIEKELGTLDDRRAAEHLLSEKVTSDVFENIPGETFRLAMGTDTLRLPVIFGSGRNEEELKTLMTYSDMEAREAISVMWAKTAAIQEDRVTTPVLQDNSDSYDHLVANAADADEAIGY